MRIGGGGDTEIDTSTTTYAGMIAIAAIVILIAIRMGLVKGGN